MFRTCYIFFIILAETAIWAIIDDVSVKKSIYLTNCLPIKPPIRKQTICAIIKSITSTESFLPLRFSIMVPCIFSYPRVLVQWLKSRLTYAKIFKAYRRRNRSDQRGRGQTRTRINSSFGTGVVFQDGSRRYHTKENIHQTRGIREISNFEISNSRSTLVVDDNIYIDVSTSHSFRLVCVGEA